MFKFILVLVIVSSLQAFAKGYGQTIINVNFQNVTLKKAFKEIEKKSDYRFLYNDDILAKNVLPASLNVTNASLDEAMTTLLAKTNLVYKLSENNLVILSEKGATVSVLTVTGKVTDETDLPMPGVTVKVKGTDVAAQTDVQGRYLLNIPDASASNVVLVFSFVGYASQEAPLNGNSALNVQLKAASNSLNEVIVVGYGTQKKENLTGSVAVVNMKDANKRTTPDVARALQGQVAGVQVNGSGVPGEGVSIRIRGVSSLNSNNPLFIIDGVPTFEPFDFPTTDIESLQVIKDASAGAIYGFRGANGVIIITTKKGKNGPMKINYNGYAGFQKNPKTLSVTDRVGYQQIADAAETNAGLSLAPGNDPTSAQYIKNVNTDWQKSGFKTGYTQSHDLGLSGGNDNMSYNVALDYFNQTGTTVSGPAYTRYNLSGNIQGKRGIVSFGTKFAYTEGDYRNLAYPHLHGTGNQIVDLVTAIPTMPIYDPNRVGGYGGVDQNTQRAISLNIIGVNNLLSSTGQRNRMMASTWMEVEIVKNLKYRISGSYDRNDFRNTYFDPIYDLGWFYPNTTAYYSDARGNYYTGLVENTLSYKLNVNKHNFEILAGTAYQKNYDSNLTGVATNLSQPYLFALDNVSDPTDKTAYSNSSITKFYSPIFARLNYNYDDRYLLTFNYRRDGSSQLTPQHRYGNFPGASIGWNINKEKFIHLPEIITQLKLKAGYGILGNINALSNAYPYQTIVNGNASYVFGNTLASGTTQTAVFDQTNRWEQKKTTNIGLDLSMFHDQLAFSSEYYINRISGVLLGIPIPPSVGAINTPPVNAASFTNKGIEFTVTYRSRDTGPFNYTISANASTLKNRVTSLGNGGNPIYGAYSKTEVGGEVGELYAFKTEGIFKNAADVAAHATQTGAAPGDVKFVDTDHNGIINDNDRVYLGSAIPKLYYGFNLSATYKNIDASIFIQGNYGNKIANGVYQALMTGQYGNQSTDELNYWTPTNTNTNVPRPIIGDPNANGRNSDRFIQSGSYARLQTAQLGYTIPTSILNHTHVFRSFRVYLSGQNLYTITKYKGYDPDFINDGTLNRGFDYGSFPNPRTLLVGLQVGL
ncbi:TonB-dependent receptor [Mucilaginibacter sp. FT3.2]|uniref:TonB-dependent receptor n=1 Tax=Mucilaginibacter sp. FT3.2 TaxID=2723090 RepID=UPI00161187BB|nr:TonB-dependent receptor [Mucilaginibacter sp. FT3.2]MBB6231148.1 TonB-linked SusC/RagA family outer membrane protein [Mucilaginibacter sp. FT3.2]